MLFPEKIILFSFLFITVKLLSQKVHYCILDMEIGKRDLRQCADAVIRLRAEYLYHLKHYKEIHFNFTSGDTAWYTRYAKGCRASIQGNKVNWQKTADKDTSYHAFREYRNQLDSSVTVRMTV